MQDRGAEGWKAEGEEEVVSPMMFEGKHIHYSPVDNKPLCSYSAKLCKQRRLNGYAFCIRHILEDKSAPFKQCAHVARYNKQKCTNPIPSNEDRQFCNSHMQVAGILPKKERKYKKEKEKDSLAMVPGDGKLKFADRLRALLRNENDTLLREDPAADGDDPYAFPEALLDEAREAFSSSGARLGHNCIVSRTGIAGDGNLIGGSVVASGCAGDQVRTDGKLPKCQSSKTMNRLQAKIAQNKLLDKLKKSQDLSSSSSHNHVAGVCPSGDHHPNPHGVGDPCFTEFQDDDNNEDNESDRCLSFQRIIHPVVAPTNEKPFDPLQCHAHMSMASTPARRCSESRRSSVDSSGVARMRKTSTDGNDENVGVVGSRSATAVLGTDGSRRTTCVTVRPKMTNEAVCSRTKMPSMLRKVQECLEAKRRRKRDLYPFGFESSESESSESEEDPPSVTWCRRWQRCWDVWQSQGKEECHGSTRAGEQCRLKANLRFHCRQLLRMHHLHARDAVDRGTILRHLVATARSYPRQTAVLLLRCLNVTSNQKQNRSSSASTPVRSVCCYHHEGYTCERPALPYTRHCVRHIMYNVDQLLFEHCTAKFADNTQCCTPVFDISHELPLCFEHAQKRDNYNRMTSEPSPKKPRKKSKPSALTRPPKRGKKKKRQGGGSSGGTGHLRPIATPPSPSRCCYTESSSSDLPPSLSLDQVPLAPPDHSGLAAEVVGKGLANPLDSDLASELEGHLSPEAIELPLDTAELANQASKLLEEHDFTEVLNKIPDDAFTDLFAENRNGEYVPTKEETEELERALAAVSKDVHLAKESLAKLSASAHDMHDLDATPVDLHASLLAAENLALAENAFHELTQANLDGLGVINGNLAASGAAAVSDLGPLGHAFQSAERVSANADANPLLPSTMVSVPLLSTELTTATHVPTAEPLVANPGLFQNGGSAFLDGSSFASLDPSSSSSVVGTFSAPAVTIPVCHLTSQQAGLSDASSAFAASGGGASPWMSDASTYQNGLVLGSHAGAQAASFGTSSYGAQQLLANLCKYSFHNLGGSGADALTLDSGASDGSSLVTLCGPDNNNHHLVVEGIGPDGGTLNDETVLSVSNTQPNVIAAATVAQEGAS